MDGRERFNGLLDHVRAIVARAEMFDPRDRRKIVTKADKLWTELRSARKRQSIAEWFGPNVSDPGGRK
jgi:hypothetical protein